ncbi:MAG: hypothetical protein LBU60_06385 [Clostridiales bacterium]|nr:hypothetical protein [Clostridiales bacterium]
MKYIRVALLCILLILFTAFCLNKMFFIAYLFQWFFVPVMIFTVIMMIVRIFTGYEDKTNYGSSKSAFFDYLLLKKENVYLVWWIITSLAMLFISFLMANLFFESFVDYLTEENYYHMNLFWSIISTVILIMFSIGYYIYQKNQLRNQQN